VRLKKNLFADLLAVDIVQEIEMLLGRQALEALDLEPWKSRFDSRFFSWRAGPWRNVSTRTFPIKWGAAFLVLVDGRRAMQGVVASKCKVSLAPCT
jgi:hypothetical protein